jgi:hypothetical protein
MPTQTQAPTDVTQFTALNHVAWSDITNILATDGAVSSVTLPPGKVSDYLVPGDFGFTIPDAAIADIQVHVRIRGTGDVDPADLAVTAILTLDGISSLQGNPNFFYITTSWQTLTLDGFNPSLTSAQINSAGFGVVFYASYQLSGSGDVLVEIDSVAITVTYRGGTSTIILFLS